MENNEDKIPTAEEILSPHLSEYWRDAIKNNHPLMLDLLFSMKEFAKMHVENALEAARNKARLVGVPVHNDKLPNETDVEYVYERNDNNDYYMYSIDGYTIINAYSLLTNIK